MSQRSKTTAGRERHHLACTNPSCGWTGRRLPLPYGSVNDTPCPRCGDDVTRTIRQACQYCGQSLFHQDAVSGHWSNRNYNDKCASSLTGHHAPSPRRDA